MVKSSPTAGSSRRASILIVEDDPEWQKRLQRTLEDALVGYRLSCTTVATHMDMKSRLETGQYDIAIVDFDLNGSWKTDAIHSARLLENMQPSCIRIGTSAVFQYADQSLRDLYHKVLPRYLTSQALAAELKEYGF